MKQKMQKKWLSWLLISLAALVVVAAVLWLRYGNKMFYKNVYTDPVSQVSFAYPQDWNLLTGGDNPYLVATVTSPNIKEYTPSFNVTKEKVDETLTLDAYVEKTVAQLKEVIIDFSQESVESTTIDGQPAKKMIFHGRYLDRQFSWEQVYAMKNHTIYVMTYLAPSEEFTGYKSQIDASFETFSMN